MKHEIRSQERRHHHEAMLNDALRLITEAGIELSPITEAHERQVRNVVLAWMEANDRPPSPLQLDYRPPERLAREAAYLYYSAREYISTRNARVEDLKSKEVQEARRIRRELLGGRTKTLTECFDGRIFPITMDGSHGEAYRVAGGWPSEAEPDSQTREITLSPTDPYAIVLLDTLRREGPYSHQLGCHVHCKAQRLTESQRLRVHPEELADGGLRADVIKKMLLAHAIDNLVAEHGAGRHIDNFLATIDPEDCSLYVGLDTPAALGATENSSRGYAPEVLQQLAADGTVLHTKSDRFLDLQFEEESSGSNISLRQLFNKHSNFDFDYINNYRGSTRDFWRAMKAMVGEGALAPIEDELKRIYPELEQPDKRDDLRARALTLLGNAFTVHLFGDNYPFKHHPEGIVVAVTNEIGPYGQKLAFGVNPNSPDLFEQMALANDIIRENREKRTTAPRTAEVLKALFGNQDDRENLQAAKQAPVTDVMLSRLKLEDEFAERHRTHLESLDWGFLRDRDWMAMTADQFLEEITSQWSDLPMFLARRFVDLFNMAQRYYRSTLRNQAFRGDTVPLFALAGSGSEGENILVVPFISAGSPH